MCVCVCSEDSLLEFLHHSWQLGTAGFQKVLPLSKYSFHWVLSFLREIGGGSGSGGDGDGGGGGGGGSSGR